MNWKLLLLLALLLIAYLLAGAFLFVHLEGRQDTEVEEDLRVNEQKKNVTIAQPGLPDNFTQALLVRYPSLREDELAGLVNMVVTAYTDGTLPTNTSTKVTTTGTNWDVSTGFFFVGTVVTTIGYGNVVPVTMLGRVTTIFYGLIGIPLCLIFLAALGEKLLVGFKWVEKLCGHKCHRCEKSCHVMRVVTLTIIGWGLFLLIPAIIFSQMEGWDYLESIYFCFVTLSTIGFGDLVTTAHATNNKALYRVLTVTWVYVGLAWLSSLIALISEILQKKIYERGNQVQKRITDGEIIAFSILVVFTSRDSRNSQVILEILFSGNRMPKTTGTKVHSIARHVSSKVHHHAPEDPDKQNGTEYHINQTNTNLEEPEGEGKAQEDQGTQTDDDKPAQQSLTE